MPFGAHNAGFGTRLVGLPDTAPGKQFGGSFMAHRSRLASCPSLILALPHAAAAHAVHHDDLDRQIGEGEQEKLC